MNKRTDWRRYFSGFLALSLVTFAGNNLAQAETAANAKIVNVVRVDYKDASGGSSFTKSATATVTVNLLAAAPTVTAPTPGSGVTVDSGATQTYSFDIYSNANGPDTYDLALSYDGTPADVNYVNNPADTRDKYISSVTDPTGATTVYASGDVSVNDINIGATIIIGDDGGNTVTIPAGTGTANGIDDGDFVIIDGVTYKVGVVNNGTIAAHNTTNNNRDSETHGTVTLFVDTENDQAWDDVADLSVINLAGFTLSERYVVEVTVTADADSAAAADADIYFNLTLSADGAGTPPTPASSSQTDIKTTFTRSQLTITKTADVASAKPGDEITYTVLVALNGSKATSVIVTDAVPEYTTLKVASGDFASIRKCTLGSIGAGPVINYDPLTCGTAESISTATDDESATIGSGDAAGSPTFAYPSAIRFFIGNTNDGSSATGGDVLNNEVFEITYTVTIL